MSYRRDVLAVLSIVRKGRFGTLVHGRGGYQHALRGVLFNNGKTPYRSGAEFVRKRRNHLAHAPDTSLLHPYSLGFRVQQAGIWEEYGLGALNTGNICFEKLMQHRHKWNNTEK